MKIDKLEFKATIPVAQYSNIQPGIEISDVSIKEGTEVAMGFLGGLFEKYSEKGGLIPKESIQVVATKKSFNEGIDIGVEPIHHVYSYEGKTLTGVTEYIKRFYKPFDSETISSVLESKWGVPQQSIRDLWNANGELASDFGNLVHKALEFYEKFKDTGEIISSSQKEEENYCLPKHPILRNIIKEFIEKNGENKGKIVAEVLISDVKNGICGTADRIIVMDEAKKICRVADYKVNVNSEEVDKNSKVLAPFNDLPSTKLSKYQLQMSVYANMLQNTGWTVEGLDVWVYEDSWKKFELPVIKVIN